MKHRRTCWNTLAALLILASLTLLTGCQGISTGKSATQNPPPGQLTAAPSSATFGNVQVGTTQNQTNTLTNTGGSSLTITQAPVTGTGFSLSGLSLPLTLPPGQSTTFSVAFKPTSAGSASGSLAIIHDGSNSPANIALSGTGVSAGTLTLSPTSFSFGNVAVGSNQSQTETLKNTGSANLTISQATVTASGFSVTGLSLPLTLTPNQSTTFGVRFAPTSAGASNGNVSLTISGSSTSMDIAFSGTGVPPATLTATPSSLTFNVQAGKTQILSETIQNTGGVDATISQATASGTGFSISGITAPLTLTPGQSASFSVTFAPQTSGNYSGSVGIASNASNPSLTISLTGTATAQSGGQLSVSPTTIGVGSVVVGLRGTQTGSLTATGANVVVSSVTLGGTNPSEFSISGLSFPVTVTTSQSLSFTVKFTPGATGAASATASFASDASNSPTVASLTGTGTPAPVHTVQLSWVASTTTGITSYNIYRAVFGSSCGSYSNIGSTAGSATAYTDNAVTDGTSYCYATTAVDPNGESAFSSITQATIPPP
jgi:hypothetical protein